MSINQRLFDLVNRLRIGPLVVVWIAAIVLLILSLPSNVPCVVADGRVVEKKYTLPQTVTTLTMVPAFNYFSGTVELKPQLLTVIKPAQYYLLVDGILHCENSTKNGVYTFEVSSEVWYRVEVNDAYEAELETKSAIE